KRPSQPSVLTWPCYRSTAGRQAGESQATCGAGRPRSLQRISVPGLLFPAITICSASIQPPRMSSFMPATGLTSPTGSCAALSAGAVSSLSSL
ncbi:uncharacterized protein METZ01_LOCUS439039, partial [marine metagenome]